MQTAGVTDKGFTLIDLLLVVALVGILAMVAGVSYEGVIKKAQSVEAEMTLAEINRLAQFYYAQTGVYGGDLAAIGFIPVPGLKFYSVDLRLAGGTGGVAYEAYAYPKDNSEGSAAMVLTQYEDGRVSLERFLLGAGAVSARAESPGSGSFPNTAGQPGSQSSGGGGVGDNPLGGSGSSSVTTPYQGPRSVIHVPQTIGMKAK